METLQDGLYVFSVVTAGATAGQQSAFELTVGQPLPRVQMTAAPPAVSGSGLAQLSFTSNGDVQLECSLQNSSMSSQQPVYTSCTSPK
jgi:hypothetical protein